MYLCNSPNGGKVLQKSFLLKDTLKLLSSLPGSFATRTEVVEEDPACPRGPLSGCVSKQTPEHVTHATHPTPAVLPCTGHGGGDRRPGLPHIPASPPRLPGQARLGLGCLPVCDRASGNAEPARRWTAPMPGPSGRCSVTEQPQDSPGSSARAPRAGGERLQPRGCYKRSLPLPGLTQTCSRSAEQTLQLPRCH